MQRQDVIEVLHAVMQKGGSPVITVLEGNRVKTIVEIPVQLAVEDAVDVARELGISVRFKSLK
jgi:hypothetical protein